MDKILITGATGLIGSSLIEPLSSLFEVYAISRSTVNEKIGNIKWHYADLSHDFDLNTVDKLEAVIYLAQSENYRNFPEKL